MGGAGGDGGAGGGDGGGGKYPVVGTGGRGGGGDGVGRCGGREGAGERGGGGGRGLATSAQKSVKRAAMEEVSSPRKEWRLVGSEAIWSSVSSSTLVPRPTANRIVPSALTVCAVRIASLSPP